MPITQSMFCHFHSTETAVTKIYNHLLFVADGGQMSALCLLDLTAAFDNVDHTLLLDRLAYQFGLHENVLLWFQSYLSDRIFQVVYGGNTSHIVVIFCSVPQRSVLGLRLFILYTADIADNIDKHDVNFHACANDSQLYIHCDHCKKASTAA